MKSIGFPYIFNNIRTRIYKDNDATTNNLKLLLLSEKGSLFGDPYFGTTLHKMLYEQNSVILKDLVIDDIYTAILEFMPQLRLSRSDIEVYSKGTEIYVSITALNMLDYTTNMYEIKLTES